MKNSTSVDAIQYTEPAHTSVEPPLPAQAPAAAAPRAEHRTGGAEVRTAEWTRRNPLTTLGLAMIGGLAAAALMPSRSRKRNSHELAERTTDRERPQRPIDETAAHQPRPEFVDEEVDDDPAHLEEERKEGILSTLLTAALATALASRPAQKQQERNEVWRAALRGRGLSPYDQSNHPAHADHLDQSNSQQPNTPKRQRHRGESKSYWQLLKNAASDFSTDKGTRLAAATAYYAIFSIAPLLVLAITIASFIYGEQAANQELTQQLETVLGQKGAESFQSVLAAGATNRQGGILATVFSTIVLIFGATSVFAQLKDGLNTIWEVELKPDVGIKGTIMARVLSFFVVLLIGLLLLAMVALSAVLATVSSTLNHLIPGPDIWAWILNAAVSIAVFTLLFAVIFRYLPDAQIAWSDVWHGAAFTAVLFLIGNYLFGWYVSTAGVGSTYGAAGSILVVLLWAYYSSMIFYFGAELTQAYSTLFGSPIRPADNARFIEGRC